MAARGVHRLLCAAALLAALAPATAEARRKKPPAPPPDEEQAQDSAGTGDDQPAPSERRRSRQRPADDEGPAPASDAPAPAGAAGRDRGSDDGARPAGGGKSGEKASSAAGGGAFARIADDQETIYAVQRKAYLVNHKIEITPLLGADVTDTFVHTIAPGLSLTYHLAENFGIELFGAYMFPSESALRTEILQKQMLTPEVAKLTQMLWGLGVGLQWSPIYGKVQLLGSYLGNFNFYLGVGGAIGQTRVECAPGMALDPNRGFSPSTCGAKDLANDTVYEPARLVPMGTLSGGIRFYFSTRLGLKVEIKDWLYSESVYRPGSVGSTTAYFTDSVRNNVFAQIGLSFLLGGEE